MAQKQNKKVQSHPKVSIVIVNWNSLNDICACLKSLKKTDYCNYEIIIVDNGSTDKSVGEIERLFPEVTLLKNKENLGSSGGNNTGMKYAIENGTQYIWLLNADTKVTSSALSTLVLTAETDPRIGIVSPLLYHYNSPSIMQYCGSVIDRSNYIEKHFENLEELENVNQSDFWLWGTAYLVRPEVIEAIGYYDEKYFVYCDDMNFSLRTSEAGYLNRIERSAIVYHRSHYIGNERKLPDHYYFYITRNQYFFWLDKVKGFKKIAFIRKYIAKTIIRIVQYGQSNNQDAVNACLDGLYCGLRNKGGKWDKNFNMPKRMKDIIFNHPYFLVDFFECNWGKIIKEFFNRAKRKFFKNNKFRKNE